MNCHNDHGAKLVAFVTTRSFPWLSASVDVDVGVGVGVGVDGGGNSSGGGSDGSGGILQRYFLLALLCIIAFATSCKKSMLTPLAIANDHLANAASASRAMPGN
ncbi:hypothetical protein EAI_13629 [Harpegnathos saltator]|uniref:Uncharacterized protein n=1 Tax=Harpegnathos saltator TaxID=610380 RepID=E2BDV1_HARSA|nr:hypothetical protein EAI_13629 [Harpegnathos saltator]